VIWGIDFIVWFAVKLLKGGENMYNLHVDDLTIDGFDIESASIEKFLDKFFWEVNCLNGLGYSSLPEKYKKKSKKPAKKYIKEDMALFNSPADAIIALTKRCCQQRYRRRAI
jgi:hypothetical protein